MKIVDRKTFLAMPDGTLFSKYVPCVFGELCIKGRTTSANDFFVQSIQDAIAHNSSEDFFDSLENAQATGCSLSMDFDFEGRDGLFDKEQLFAVWEKVDVEALIVRLQQSQIQVESS